MRPIAEIQRDIRVAAEAAERDGRYFQMPPALGSDVDEMERRYHRARKFLAAIQQMMSQPGIGEALTTYNEMTAGLRPQIEPPQPAPAMWDIAQLRYDSAAKDLLLAEKDERIEVLERRLRSLMFPALFGDDEYPPMLAEYFGRN